jgi:RNA polymerase sigma-70 factor (ECF subfamily)
MVLLLDKPLTTELPAPTLVLTPPRDEDGLGWLEALYDAHHRQAIGLAAGILGDRAEAEDVVHEACLTAWRARHLFNPERGSLKSWFLTMVRNKAIDVLRARRLRSTEPLDVLVDPPANDDPVATVLQRLDQGWIGAALLQLPGEQRQVIELAYFNGLSHGEISTLLGLPLGTVKSRTRLALDRLRTLLNVAR